MPKRISEGILAICNAPKLPFGLMGVFGMGMVWGTSPVFQHNSTRKLQKQTAFLFACVKSTKQRKEKPNTEGNAMDVIARPQFGPVRAQLGRAEARVHTSRSADSLRGGSLARQFRRVSHLGAGCSASAHGRQRLVAVVAAASAGTVRLIIQGRNLELTEAVRDYAEQKISKAVEHYEQVVKEVDVNMSVRGGDTGTKGDKQQKIEVTVHTLRNGIVRSETVAENMYASIDLVCDKVQRKLQKVKEKAMQKGKWPGRGGTRGGPKVGELMEPITEIELNKVVELPPDIVRTKYHALKALTEVEAAEELERLEHDFFLFKDIKSGEVRVLYRRKERGYGVIVPIDEAA